MSGGVAGGRWAQARRRVERTIRKALTRPHLSGGTATAATPSAMITAAAMDAEGEQGMPPAARTALLFATLAAVILAGSHLAYQYLRLAEGYARLILH
jgi:hypothetical protein